MAAVLQKPAHSKNKSSCRTTSRVVPSRANLSFPVSTSYFPVRSSYTLPWRITYAAVDLFDDRTGQQQGQQIGGATSPDVQTKALAPGQSLQLGGYPPVPFNADPLNRGRAPSSRIIPPPPFHTQLSTPSQDHRFSSSNPVPGFSHSPAITLRPAEWTSPSSTLPAPLIDRKRYACELCGKRFER